jgi:hypothetical protein
MISGRSGGGASGCSPGYNERNKLSAKGACRGFIQSTSRVSKAVGGGLALFGDAADLVPAGCVARCSKTW